MEKFKSHNYLTGGKDEILEASEKFLKLVLYSHSLLDG